MLGAYFYVRAKLRHILQLAALVSLTQTTLQSGC